MNAATDAESTAAAKRPMDREAGPWPGPWGAFGDIAQTDRVLVLLGSGPSRDLMDLADRGLAPRLDYVELARAVGGQLMSYEQRPGGPIAGLARKAPLLASSLTGFLARRRFSAIYVTGEDIGLRIAPLLRLSGWRGRLVMVVHGCVSGRRKAYMRALGGESFHALICVSEAQHRILVEDVGLPEHKVHAVRAWTDIEFFSPDAARSDVPGGYVFSCGLENRDYATLLAAARVLPFNFTIAASGFWGANQSLGQVAPANVSTLKQRVPYAELRRIYGDSRFVVVPLHAAPYAAGVTGLLEGMAMGKAVIATASPGVAEYVEDGVSGFVVAPGDAAALAAAIRRLWDAPELCERMGRRNRAWVQANGSMTDYVRFAGDLVT